MNVVLQKLLDVTMSTTFIVMITVFVVYVAGHLGVVPY